MKLKLHPTIYIHTSKSSPFKVETLKEWQNAERNCGSPTLLPTVKKGIFSFIEVPFLVKLIKKINLIINRKEIDNTI